jgi:protein SCO1/2
VRASRWAGLGPQAHRGLVRVPLWGHLLALLAALATAAIVAWLRPGAPAALPGTDLGGGPAPSFRLTDHRGVSVGLEDMRGRPVVLAFLYTNCPDVCRLTGAGLRQTAELLGDDARRVQLLAVSVDPVGDDAASVRRYLARYALTERMLYLTGPREALPLVWRSYHLFVNTEGSEGLEAHTDALFLLDRAGRERALLRSDFDPSELAAGLRALLRESW